MTKSFKRKVKLVFNFYILYMLICDLLILYIRTKLGLKTEINADGIASLFLFYTILDKVIFETILFGFIDSALKAMANLRTVLNLGLKLANIKL